MRGIRNLHAKMFLFGDTRAIITSANLTDAGLDRNAELGVATEAPAAISGCATYFDRLWTRGYALRLEEAYTWATTIAAFRAAGGGSRTSPSLGDFGADIGYSQPMPISAAASFLEGEQAFVKFLGQFDNRVDPSWTAIQELERAGCHWAVAYPRGRRPRIVKDGDVIFIARLTNEPDTRIFGRAVAVEHVPGRDDASDSDIDDRRWKARWCHYIRLHHAEFLSGRVGDGVSLRELMNALESNAFASTQENFRRRHGNLDPRKSLRRQPAVRLSAEGRAWLTERLEAAFRRCGLVSAAEFEKLDWPETPAPLAPT